MNCIIVDDEELARELLADYISKIPDLDLLASFDGPLKAKTYMSQNKVDLLFLDIQMPNLTGIEFLKILDPRPLVILTTAYEEHALEGYELSVIDYLLKPIPFERFYRAVSKAKDFSQMTIKDGDGHIASSGDITQDKPYFFVKADGKLVKVIFDEILFIQGFREYVRIYTESDNIITLLSLSRLEEILPRNSHYRVHKSYIINLDKVMSVDGDYLRIDTHNVPISRRSKKDFLEKLNRYNLF